MLRLLRLLLRFVALRLGVRARLVRDLVLRLFVRLLLRVADALFARARVGALAREALLRRARDFFLGLRRPNPELTASPTSPKIVSAMVMVGKELNVPNGDAY